MTPTNSPAAVTRGRQTRRRGLPLDARLCAWIAGLAVAALLCLFVGDTLFALASGGH